MTAVVPDNAFISLFKLGKTLKQHRFMEEAYVSSHVEHGINTIEFYHPQGNSLPTKILEKLAHEIHFAGTHSETKVIVLKSAGAGAFCGGASFDELSKIQNEAEGTRFFSGFANVINAMRKCPKFIIGRLHGKCVGGGVGIAASVDYAIATDKCEIKLSELTFGIAPFVVGPAIERRIGISAFSHLSIDAAIWRNADWAKRKGLLSEVHSSAENMDESIARLSNSLSHYNPELMKELKKSFWAGTEHWDELLREKAALNGKFVTSSYTRKAIEKFNAVLVA